VTDSRRGNWREEWKGRKNINLKRASFDKLTKLKQVMKVHTWEELIDKLYEEKVQKNIVKL